MAGITLDVTCLPAKLHHNPALIPEAIRTKIRESRDRYLRIYVLYGDCGTGGLLDQVLEDEGGIERIPGPHCFSFFMGNDRFAAKADDEIATFYLTDYFCRHFEKFVWKALGLDRRADYGSLRVWKLSKAGLHAANRRPGFGEKSPSDRSKARAGLRISILRLWRFG